MVSGYLTKKPKPALERISSRGGNFVDTAIRYGNSERIIGEFFRKNPIRENVFIASKTGQTKAADIRNDIKETLRLLQCNYVDIYYLHHPPDDPAEMDRILDIYEQLKKEGKIRAIGASVKGPDVTQRTVDLCRQYIRSGRVDVLEVIYSIFRQKNREMLQEAFDKGVGIVGRTVLESGFLTGKYAPGHKFTGNDHRKRWGKERLTKILKHAQELKQFALTPPYQTLGQVAIRFALDQKGISSVIIGAKSVQQVKDNMTVASLPSLGQELRKRLSNTYGDLTAEFNTGE